MAPHHNPCIDWPILTLHLNWDSLPDSVPVLFNISTCSQEVEYTINIPWTPLQLCSKSTQSFIIIVQLGNSSAILPALVDSRASSIFISKQLNFLHNTLNTPLKLQLFDGSPVLTGITQYHDNSLMLNNNLRFQDINPNINWKSLTMQFPGPNTSLAAIIPLHLQSPSNSNIPNLDSSSSGAAQNPTTLKDNQ
ncbi:hypothetical protein E4T56_gene8398 [Termitomyces sp. T112]|nr:hypothetical protein E4T56_gene8398 [Termitomyces sp. T112]